MDYNQLKEIYSRVNWAELGKMGNGGGKNLSSYRYNGYSFISLIKLLTLPFLTKIQSERDLAKQLAEKPQLQELCDFVNIDETKANKINLPTRPSLWHVRQKYPTDIKNLVLNALVEMAYKDGEIDQDMPYIKRAELSDVNDSPPNLNIWEPKDFTLSTSSINSATSITVQQTIDDKTENRDEQLSFFLFQSSKRKSSLPIKYHAFFGLPLLVDLKKNRIKRDNNLFWIVEPVFLDPPVFKIHSTRKKPYVVCHILVLQKNAINGKVSFLFSRRIMGFGKDLYGVPGGKINPSENLINGVLRELREETGLTVSKITTDDDKKSYFIPISSDIQHFQDKPKVLSLGFLLRDYDGNPKLKEFDQNEDWQWWSIEEIENNLDKLFLPARKVVEDYKKNYDPSRGISKLSWSYVEKQNKDFFEPDAQQLELEFQISSFEDK
ncbi:MAG: NUDIX hydrolase [Anaerolineae bacterium]|nr:NUDIX hydrolase [Anaerolineae bacterium]